MLYHLLVSGGGETMPIIGPLGPGCYFVGAAASAWCPCHETMWAGIMTNFEQPFRTGLIICSRLTHGPRWARRVGAVKFQAGGLLHEGAAG